jgi:hypothetical protein
MNPEDFDLPALFNTQSGVSRSNRSASDAGNRRRVPEDEERPATDDPKPQLEGADRL